MSALRGTDRLAWLERRVSRVMGADAVGFEAVDDRASSLVLGMVAFEWWGPNSVGVHVAVESPLALRHVRRVLSWAFAAREVVWALVEDGARSERLARHLGFTERGRLPRAGSEGRDLVLVAMTRSEFEKESSHVRKRAATHA